MNHKPLHISALTILLAVSLAGCGQQAQPALEQEVVPTATVTSEQTTDKASEQLTSPASNHLAQALTFAPDGTTEFSFIDWGLIKEYEGSSSLNSKASVAERKKFFLTLGVRQPMIAQGVWSLAGFDTFSDAWSWDATDLIWDATIMRNNEAPVSVIKFRDDFDFAPVLAHFPKRDFQESQYGNVAIYSHTTDGFASDGLDAAVFNTAVVSNQNIFVLSWASSGVYAALDANNKQGSDSLITKQIGSIPERLGEQIAVLFRIGAGACPFPGPTLRTESQASNDILAQKASHAHLYSALAIAYRFEGTRTPGMFVFHYPDATTAQLDLEVRSNEADKGNLLLLEKDAPISSYLTLDKAVVEGNDIIMQVQPSSSHILFDMVSHSDMTFAACP